MANINLGDFYADPLSEIFSNLSFEDLLASYTVNKNWQKTLQGVIRKRITEGALQEYALPQLGDLGKSYPFINTFLIREIHQRLHHNYLQDFLQQFPDGAWNYDFLSANPNITMSNVLAQPNAGWNFKNLSANPAIKLADILNHPELPWDSNTLAENPNIIKSPSVDHLNIIWFNQKYAINPNLTMKDILSDTNVQQLFYLAQNPNITLVDVLKYPNIPWDYGTLSANPNITLADILAHPSEWWNYENLGFNNNITVADVLAHPELKWHYLFLSRNLHLNPQELLNSNIVYATKWLSLNPNLTIADILAKSDFDWNGRYLAENPGLTVQDAIQHPEIFWDKYALNKNPNIRLEDIREYPELPWDLALMAVNNFSKDPAYIILAQNIIRSLLPEKIPVLIKGQKRLLTAETVYGLILGLTATNKIQTNPVTFYGITLDLATAKMFFSTPIRETTYLVYIQDKPYHFQDLTFLSALKSTGVPLTNFYDKNAKYTEKIII